MIVPRNRLILWFALVGLPFSVLAGAHPPAITVCAAVITGFLLLVAVDAFMSRLTLKGLYLEAPAVSRMALGKDGGIDLRIQNQSHATRALRLALSLPREITAPCDELSVSVPGDATWSTVSWPCRPEKRGNFLVDTICLESSSPLGFWNLRKRMHLRTEIRVYPNLERSRRSLGLIFRGALGAHAQRQIGKGREFEKLRDYVPGDGSEDIHWKATARRGRPVTKVFQIERTQEVYVALDTSRLSAREDAIEHHLSAALLMGMAAEKQRDLFGLLAFSDRVEAFVRASNGASHYHSCRDAIFALQPRMVNPDFDEVCSFIRLRLRRRALVIILTALDDPLLADNFMRNIDLIARQHIVVVGMMKPEGVAPLFGNPGIASEEALYAELAGHLRWQKLEEVGRLLKRRGVKLAVFDSASMSIDLVSEYLTIKKRQLL